MARIMGIDYGIRRIGIAVSDPLRITARPLVVIDRISTVEDDIEKIALIVKEQEVSHIVMGTPLNMDGSAGILTEEVEQFKTKIEEKTKVSVELYDERLTTLQAERILVEEADISREKRKKLRDKVAASLILQSWLEHHQ